MKKLYSFFLILIIAITLYIFKNSSFSNDNQSKENIPITFDLNNLKETTGVKLSDLGITEIHYVPLETSQRALIKDIFLLKSDKNSIYIFDYLNIKRFALDGSFNAQIGKRGKGYGEYHLMSDFSVGSDNQDIYILSPHENKIYIYSLDGRFIKIIPSPAKTMKIHCLDKQIFCYSQNHEGNVENTFDVIDLDGNILKSFPNKYKFEVGKYLGFWKYECLICFNKGNLLTKELYSDTVFNYSRNIFKPAYVFINGGKTLPSIERHFDSSEDFIKTSQKYKADRNLLVFGDYVYYEFSFKEYNYSFIGSTDGEDNFLTMQHDGYVNDVDGGPNIFFKSTLNDCTIVSWINPVELKKYIASESFKKSSPKFPEKKKQLENLANKLRENDNPVLIFMKLGK